MEVGDQSLRKLAGRDTFALRAHNDLVVDIGEIDDMPNFIADVLEIAPDHVEDDGRHRMADVRVVIRRDSADVHAHHAGFDRLERLDFPRKGAVELQAVSHFRNQSSDSLLLAEARAAACASPLRVLRFAA